MFRIFRKWFRWPSRKPAGGLLASNFEQVKKTSEFFTWFHLEEFEPRRHDSGNVIVSLKPTGEAFRKWVTVKIRLSALGDIVGLELQLDREFVDHARQSMFARDIAKSLLRSGLPAEDQAILTDTICEIESGYSGQAPLIVGPRTRPKLPERNTPGYSVYLGQQEQFTQKLHFATATFENINSAKTAELRIMISLS